MIDNNPGIPPSSRVIINRDEKKHRSEMFKQEGPRRLCSLLNRTRSSCISTTPPRTSSIVIYYSHNLNQAKQKPTLKYLKQIANEIKMFNQTKGSSSNHSKAAHLLVMQGAFTKQT